MSETGDIVERACRKHGYCLITGDSGKTKVVYTAVRMARAFERKKQAKSQAKAVQK